MNRLKKLLLLVLGLPFVLSASCSKDDDSFVGPVYKQARSVKRGVGLNNIAIEDFESAKKGISWFYNWGTGYNSSLEPEIAAAKWEYFPMSWSETNASTANNIRTYKAVHPSCEYILAFNEPNLKDQANMTPSQAAEKWPALKALADELGMKIVAPAMNYGTLADYSDPIKWLDEFFALVPLEQSGIEAFSLHCYMPTASGIKSFVEMFRKYGKPIWMTEFCAWESMIKSAEDQRQYMCDVINYFESDPLIERYAWFKYDGSDVKYPYYGLRPKKAELSDLGKVYVNMSSMDTTAYYTKGEAIPAAHYSKTNMSEAVGTTNWIAGVQLKASSDERGILEVANFGLPKWLEYRVNATSTGTHRLTIRYAATTESKCKILVNGEELLEMILPSTGSYTTWKTLTTDTPVTLTEGKQSIRLKPSKGMISMSWLRLE